MKEDLFQFLPSEITINILSRLDVRAIATSKCVCKPWLDLLSTDDFINFQFSKSVPVLAVSIAKTKKWDSVWCKVFGFEDGDEDEDEVDDVERRYIPLTKFDFLFVERLLGAADGLLLLLAKRTLLYICNPITREYVELCRSVKYRYGSVYGFGASKITRQHKAVLIVRRDSRCKFEVNVYTLETGSWRCFEATAELDYDGSYRGAFVNGNLHWIRQNSIVCFDLETECFSTFSVPPLDERVYKKRFCASKDHLRVCVVMTPKYEDLYVLVSEIWVMKEYGVEKSWTKEHVIGIHQEFGNQRFLPRQSFQKRRRLDFSGVSRMHTLPLLQQESNCS